MSAAPKCAVCNHHHEQGVKCAICGHTGKSRFLQKLQNIEPVSLFAVRALDCFSGHSAIQNADAGFWSFVKMLRRHIFPEQPDELDDDARCRHLIAFVGDAPIGVCRWRISVSDPHAADSTRTVVAIEHFGMLEVKRRQGYGKQLLLETIADVTNKLIEMRLRASALLVDVPVAIDEQLAGSSPAVRLFQSSGFAVEQQQQQWRRGGPETRPCVRMTLSERSSREIE